MIFKNLLKFEIFDFHQIRLEFLLDHIHIPIQDQIVFSSFVELRLLPGRLSLKKLMIIMQICTSEKFIKVPLRSNKAIFFCIPLNLEKDF